MTLLLHMWSGGLDSTAALYKILMETNYEVHAHFIEMINLENRANSEKQAIDNCLTWFKGNCRKFEFSQSIYSFPFLKAPTDTNIVSFYATHISRHINSDIISYGATASDLNGITGARRRGEAMKDLSKFIVNIYRKAGETPLNEPTWWYPLENLTKKEIIDTFPTDLLKFTWSCRTPKKGKPCKNCHTCIELEECGWR